MALHLLIYEPLKRWSLCLTAWMVTETGDPSLPGCVFLRRIMPPAEGEAEPFRLECWGTVASLPIEWYYWETLYFTLVVSASALIRKKGVPCCPFAEIYEEVVRWSWLIVFLRAKHKPLYAASPSVTRLWLRCCDSLQEINIWPLSPLLAHSFLKPLQLPRR